MNDRLLPAPALDGLLAAAIEAADLCVAVMVGTEFRYVFANPAFQALKPDTPMIGLRYRDVFPEAVLVGAEERFRRVLETGERWHMERYFAPIAGQPDARWTGEAIRLEGASPQGAVAVFARNVTEQWRVETALAAAEAELQRSHATLERTLDSITDGVVVLDKTWRFTMVSDRAGRIIGLSPEELRGGCLWDIFPAATGTQFHACYHRAMTTQQPVHFEEYYPAPLDMWLECHAYPSPDELTVYFRDVTERRRSEAQTTELERKLLAALVAGDVATFEWRITDDFLWGDPNFLAIFGIDPDDRTATPLARFVAAIHPDDRERVMAAVNRAVETGEPYEAEYRIVRDHATPRWVIARGSVERDADGRPVRFPGTLVDITERVRMEHALRASEAKLREEDARKDRFIATLAHELRNPLAPLRNALAILRATRDREQAIESLQPMMERQIDHLTHLVDDLLDASRVTTGKIELRRAQVDLATLVRHAVETAGAAIGPRTVTFAMPDRPVHVLGDLNRIAQIVGNLLQNACKFTRPDGHVRIAVGSRDDTATIVVEDDGVGIPAASLDAIFDMFTQLGAGADESRNGLGIGLALVRQLVQLHGGHVRAESGGPGHGARFIVTLPLHVPAAPAPHVDVTRHPSLSANAPHGRSVLVVDDNRDAAGTLAAMLALAGWRTSIAHDGNAALAQAEALQPDAILMDIGMPRMDGYEACRRLRQASWATGMRVIAVSGWGQAADRRRSAEAGFDAHLVKPVSGDELMAALGSG